MEDAINILIKWRDEIMENIVNEIIVREKLTLLDVLKRLKIKVNQIDRSEILQFDNNDIWMFTDIMAEKVDNKLRYYFQLINLQSGANTTQELAGIKYIIQKGH